MCHSPHVSVTQFDDFCATLCYASQTQIFITAVIFFPAYIFNISFIVASV